MENKKEEKVLMKWRGILNERPEDMTYQEYFHYRKVQKNMIKRMIGPKLIWDSKKQGTFTGNINEYLYNLTLPKND